MHENLHYVRCLVFVVLTLLLDYHGLYKNPHLFSTGMCISLSPCDCIILVANDLGDPYGMCEFDSTDRYLELSGTKLSCEPNDHRSCYSS